MLRSDKLDALDQYIIPFTVDVCLAELERSSKNTRMGMAFITQRIGASRFVVTGDEFALL